LLSKVLSKYFESRLFEKSVVKNDNQVKSPKSFIERAQEAFDSFRYY